MLWRVVCLECGGTFCLYEGDVRPQATDRVDWRRVRNLAGRPVQPQWPALCLTCEAPPHLTPADTWERVA
jgi:hypothetical protein